MIADPLLGPAFPDAGWVPAPRYLMRRARILELARGLVPGRLLEIGPGAATLLMEFAQRGFRCEALELSAEARRMAGDLIAQSRLPIAVHAAPASDWSGRFDTLFAFDVLEHIEDDKAALAQWHSWLRPGGTLLLSVPARMKLWTAGDEWAGHFRRYERDELKQRLADAGFALERFECYGFPLTNVTEKVSARSYRRTMRRQEDSQTETRRINNDRSGIDRRPVMRLYPLMNSVPGRIGLRIFAAVQAACLDRDWGSGYVLRASRR
jgi:SAM-dependent methyltransferase